MFKFDKGWLEILSEFFINLAAGWFGVVFFEPQLITIDSIGDVFVLTLKGSLGILSLVLAKILREEARK